MRIYALLDRLPWPRSYASKFLAIAFVGVHLPLIALLVYAAYKSDVHVLPYLVAAIATTLAGTAFVLWISYGLLEPVHRTVRALRAYGELGALPDLPTHHRDEAGALMATAQATLLRLDRLTAYRSRLIGVLSHDLRTPLSSMLLAAGLLQESAEEGQIDPELVLNLSGVLTASVEQMDALLTTIHNASHVGAAELPYVPSEVTSGYVMASVVERLSLVAERKGVLLSQYDTAPASLTTDVTQLEQVLANLATNAIKFTPAGRQVRLTSEVAPGGVVFVVADEGIGMNPEQVAAAFTATGTEQRHGTSGEPGTGLGLWIVDTFTRNLGGRVTLTSQPGAGTAFRVFIPTNRSSGHRRSVGPGERRRRLTGARSTAPAGPHGLRAQA